MGGIDDQRDQKRLIDRLRRFIDVERTKEYDRGT